MLMSSVHYNNKLGQRVLQRDSPSKVQNESLDTKKIGKKMNNECFEMIQTNKLSRFESDVSFSSSMMHHHYSLHFI